MTADLDERTSVPFTAPRSTLTTPRAGAADPVLGRAGAIVATAIVTGRVVTVTTGSAKAVDLWVAPDGIVLHGHRSDVDAPCAGTVHDRSVGALVLHELGLRPGIDDTGGAVIADRIWPSATDLVDDVRNGSLGSALLTALGFSSGDTTTNVVVVTSGATSAWSAVEPDTEVRLVSGSFARLWTLISPLYLTTSLNDERI